MSLKSQVKELVKTASIYGDVVGTTHTDYFDPWDTDENNKYGKMKRVTHQGINRVKVDDQFASALYPLDVKDVAMGSDGRVTARPGVRNRYDDTADVIRNVGLGGLAAGTIAGGVGALLNHKPTLIGAAALGGLGVAGLCAQLFPRFNAMKNREFSDDREDITDDLLTEYGLRNLSDRI